MCCCKEIRDREDTLALMRNINVIVCRRALNFDGYNDLGT